MWVCFCRIFGHGFYLRSFFLTRLSARQPDIGLELWSYNANALCRVGVLHAALRSVCLHRFFHWQLTGQPGQHLQSGLESLEYRYVAQWLCQQGRFYVAKLDSSKFCLWGSCGAVKTPSSRRRFLLVPYSSIPALYADSICCTLDQRLSHECPTTSLALYGSSSLFSSSAVSTFPLTCNASSMRAIWLNPTIGLATLLQIHASATSLIDQPFSLASASTRPMIASSVASSAGCDFERSVDPLCALGRARRPAASGPHCVTHVKSASYPRHVECTRGRASQTIKAAKLGAKQR